MKIKLIILALLVTVIGFTGCDKLKDAADVTFDANYTTDLNVTITPGRDVNGTFNESATIDLASNPDVQEYLNVIQSWEIIGLTGEANNVSTDFNLINANVSVTSSDRSASWSFSNLPVTNGTTLTLDNSDGQWDTINQMLADRQEITVSFTGQTDVDDMSFTLTVTIQTRVTANPL